MASISSPLTFAAHFGIAPDDLNALGVLNPTLAADVPLFVDPLLLEASRVHEVAGDGSRRYREHFSNVIALLAVSLKQDDVAWRSAAKHFNFPEVAGTCLGYSAGTIRGSGFGRRLSTTLLRTAHEIVSLGVTDPTLFPLLGLLEDGIGPDRISDMTTNVIAPALVALTERVARVFGVSTEHFDVAGVSANLPRNPIQTIRTPVILVPTDILRPLPVATDWEDIERVARHNSALRDRVNKHIGHLWAAKSKRHKCELKQQALKSRDAFETLLNLVAQVPGRAYDVRTDPDGLVRWSDVGQEYAAKFPFGISNPSNVEEAHATVGEIVAQVQRLIEDNGLAKELWNGERPRHESTAQRLFFAIAHTYCRANGLDVSPEADSGNGPVDFKFSAGFHCRVLVELKLSTNPKTVSGYEKQIEAYKRAESTDRAYYVVIDVGKLGKKEDTLIAMKNSSVGHRSPELVFINGSIRLSASKL